MLKRSCRHDPGVSTIEYIILFVMFLSAILVMHKQVGRSFFGRWKDLGDTFGYGEQYDVNATVECGRYVPRVFNVVTQQNVWGPDIWYEQKCFECCLYTNSQTGNYQQSCQGFFPSSGLAACRNSTLYPTSYGKSGCCAQGCQSANCIF